MVFSMSDVVYKVKMYKLIQPCELNVCQVSVTLKNYFFVIIIFLCFSLF